MPIISLNGRDAVATRKANKFATWGSRNEENRVEPIANPAFEVPFQLEAGESIFTIGSCFARNVESELQNQGFRIPMRELFTTPEFNDLPYEIVNNFGTPSICNEFAWAFGADQFDENANIVEVGEGRFTDLHMINSIRPAPLDTVRARRAGLMKATRELARCRIAIMTLGLVELWWDEETATYLNTAPLPSVLKRWPDRFSLHVLSFEECYTYLRRALDIAFSKGRKDLSIILTVSPVPMMATHRNVDVITANTYSKSVLRSVAEEIVTADDRVIYFPSYESVSLSDRRFAWTDDFVHVTKEIVNLNVGRMITAFTGKENALAHTIYESRPDSNETRESLMLAEQARQARLSDDADFFKRNAQSASSPAFALEYARFLYDIQEFDALLDLVGDDNRPEMRILKTRALLATKKIADARTTIQAVCQQTPKGSSQWTAYLEVALASGSTDSVLQVEAEWHDKQPRSAGLIQAKIGKALRSLGEEELALERLSKAVALPNRATATVIECASSLLALGRADEASELVSGVVGNTNWQAKRLKQLNTKIDRALR